MLAYCLHVACCLHVGVLFTCWRIVYMLAYCLHVGVLFRSMTTVQEHGEYQLSVIEEERYGATLATNKNMLKFGTNCDLSDKHK